jgi:hypothetical protein
MELRRRQQMYGFDSVTTHQPNLEALGEVIAACRAADASESSARAAGSSGTQEDPLADVEDHEWGRRTSAGEVLQVPFPPCWDIPREGGLRPIRGNSPTNSPGSSCVGSVDACVLNLGSLRAGQGVRPGQRVP